MENNVLVVYKATSKTTKKSYVGITECFSNRIYRHKQSLMPYMNIDTVFVRAMKKYGFEDFEWKILKVCKTREELAEQEKYFIHKYNTFENGYNMTTGGDGGNTLCLPEIKNKHIENIKKGLSKLKYHSTSKTWFLYDNLYNEYILIGKNFLDFCVENQLSHQALRAVANGTSLKKFHKNFTCSFNKLNKKQIDLNFVKPKIKPQSRWIFFNKKSNIEYECFDRKEFCNKYDFKFHQARKITEKNKEINGWTGRRETIK